MWRVKRFSWFWNPIASISFAPLGLKTSIAVIINVMRSSHLGKWPNKWSFFMEWIQNHEKPLVWYVTCYLNNNEKTFFAFALTTAIYFGSNLRFTGLQGSALSCSIAYELLLIILCPDFGACAQTFPLTMHGQCYVIVSVLRHDSMTQIVIGWNEMMYDAVRW